MEPGVNYLSIFLIVTGTIVLVEALTRLSVSLFMRWMDKRRRRTR
jgi:uncharacterized membrane protein